MKPDLRKLSVVWDCPADCRPLSILSLPTKCGQCSSDHCANPKTPPQIIKMLSEIYHRIENHCFKPWSALICQFYSCFICSLSLLYALMLWATPRTETTAVPRCLARVAFLGWDPAAVVLHVIKGPLSHLLVHPPFRNSGPEPSDWDVNRENEEQRFHHMPHWDEAIILSPKLFTTDVITAYSAILLAAPLPLPVT